MNYEQKELFLKKIIADMGNRSVTFMYFDKGSHEFSMWLQLGGATVAHTVPIPENIDADPENAAQAIAQYINRHLPEWQKPPGQTRS